MDRPTKQLKNWLLDRLVPAIRISGAGGTAFVANAGHKTVVVDGRAACPLMDSLIQRNASERHTHVVIGDVRLGEVVPSNQVPQRLSWAQFVFSLFFWRRSDIADFRFLWRIITAPLVGRNRHHHVHMIRSYLVARYFALKFRELAAACDRVYVICYYDTVMLGVVRAFRLAGKPAWDVQHGNLGPTHDAYNNRRAFMLGSSFQPTAFLVWSREFGEFVEHTLGAEWESTEYAHLKGFAKATAAPVGRVTILYSLQPETPFPSEVAATMRRFTNVYWLLRPHPRQGALPPDIDCLRTLPNVAIGSASDPLISDLQVCSLHITYNSSVVHEAAASGQPSLFLDPDFIERFSVEAERGLARFVRPAELIGVLEQLVPGLQCPGSRDVRTAGQNGS